MSQVPPPGSPPSAMPPPPAGTGLTVQPEQQPAQAQTTQASPQAAQSSQQPTQTSGQSANRQVGSTDTRTGLVSNLINGAIWGPIALGVAALLAMWFSALDGQEAVRPLRLMTITTGGGGALVTGSPLLGIIYNILLGVTFGVLFALVAPRLPDARTVLIGALVFGAGIFAVDAFVLSPILSEVWSIRNDAFLLATRLVFGAVLALGFMPSRDRT